MSDTAPADPIEILFDLIVSLLIPLFFCPASNIDLDRARQAAMATLDGYHAKTVPELILVAQIIGCSLTSIGSMGLSMGDELPMPTILRLRGNVNALTGSSLRLHSVLERTRKDAADNHAKWQQAQQERERQQRHADYEAAHGLTDADILADVAEVQKMAAEANARLSRQAPTAPPEPAAPPNAAQPVPRPATEEQHRKVMWATAMAKVAEEEGAALQYSSPEEHAANKARLAALNSAAKHLMAEANQPASGLKSQPAPRL
jgi:hypothetical protein